MGRKSQLDTPTIAKLKKRVVADAERAAAVNRIAPLTRLKLSPRMLEYARLIAKGWTNRKIAERLGVATRSAWEVRNIVYARLHVSSAAEVKESLVRLRAARAAVPPTKK